MRIGSDKLVVMEGDGADNDEYAELAGFILQGWPESRCAAASREPLIKSHGICCIQNRPRARRNRRRIPAQGCNCEANAAASPFSTQQTSTYLRDRALG